MNILDYIKKKEQEMNQEQVNEMEQIADLDKMAHDCAVHPYFIMDIASGEMTAIFSCKNDATAIRSFCMNMDHMPEAIVRDAVLIDFVNKDIIFEGKNYIEKWKQQQAFIASLSKGVAHAN